LTHRVYLLVAAWH